MEAATRTTFTTLFPKYLGLTQTERFSTNENIQYFIKNQLPSRVEMVKKLENVLQTFLNQYTNLIIKRPQVANLSYSLANKANELIDKLFKQIQLKLIKVDKDTLHSQFQAISPKRNVQYFRNKIGELESLINQKYINNRYLDRKKQQEISQVLYNLFEVYHFLKSDLVTISAKHYIRQPIVCKRAFNNQQMQISEFFNLIFLDSKFEEYIDSIVQKRCRPFHNKKETFAVKLKQVRRELETQLQKKNEPNVLTFIESLISKQRHRIIKQIIPQVQNILRNANDPQEDRQCKQIGQKVDSLKRKFMNIKNNMFYMDIVRGDFAQKYKIELNKLENLYYLSNLQKYLQQVMDFVDQLLKIEQEIIGNRQKFKSTLNSKVQFQMSKFYEQDYSKKQMRIQQYIQSVFSRLQDLLYSTQVAQGPQQSYQNKEIQRRLANHYAEQNQRQEQTKIQRLERQRKLQQEKARKMEAETEQRLARQQQRKKMQANRKLKQKQEQQKRRQKLAQQKLEREKRQQQNKKKQEEQRKKRSQQMAKRQKQLQQKRKVEQQKKKLQEKQRQQKRKKQQQQRKILDQQQNKKRQQEKKRKQEQDRLKRQEDQRKKKDLQQKKKKQQQQRLKREDEQRKKREAEQKRKKEAEAAKLRETMKQEEQRKKRQRQAQQKRKKDDDEKRRKQEQERKNRDAEQKRKKEQQDRKRKQLQQRKKKQEQQLKKKQEEDKKKRQQDKKKQQQEQRKKKQAQQKKRKQQQELKKKQEQQKKRVEAEQRKKKQDQQRKRKQQQQRKRKQADEKRKREQEERKAEEQRKKKQAEDKKKKEEQQRKKKQEQAKKAKDAQQKKKKQQQQRKKKEEEQKKQKQAQLKKKKEEQQKKKKDQQEKKKKAQQQQRKKKQEQQKSKKAGKAEPKKSSGINYGDLQDELIDQDQDIKKPSKGVPAGKKANKEEDQYLQQYEDDFDDFSPDKQEKQGGEGQQGQSAIQLIAYEDLKCLNDYMKGTSYARKNKPNLESFNNKTQYVYLFEQFTQAGKFFIYGASISNAICEFAKQLQDQNVPQQQLRMTLQTIHEALAEENQKVIGAPETHPQTRLIFPLSFNNQLNIYLVQVHRAENFIIIVFKQQPKSTEQFQIKLQNFVEAFRHIYGVEEDLQIVPVIVPPQSKSVLDTFDKELPNLLLLFVMHYEQDHDFSTPLVVNQYTIERFFYVSHVLQPFYDAIENQQQKVVGFFQGLNKKYAESDKLKVMFYEAEISNGDYEADIKQVSSAFKQSFLKDTKAKHHFAMIQLINAGEQEGQFRKIIIYFSMSKQEAGRPTLTYYIVSVDDEDEQYGYKMYEMVSSQVDEKFETVVYRDFTRHNGLNQYSQWSLGLWAHVVQKRKLSPSQAFRAMTLSMTPYYVAYKQMD